jgi:hypothetical protein
MQIIHGYRLEHLAGKTCYDRSRTLTINCRCLIDANIDDTEAKAIVRSLLQFIQMKPSAQKMAWPFWQDVQSEARSLEAAKVYTSMCAFFKN